MTTKYSDIKTYDELLEELATSKDATIDALFELVELRAELARFVPVYDEMSRRNTIKYWIKEAPTE
jgi:hypothetical protein